MANRFRPFITLLSGLALGAATPPNPARSDAGPPQLTAQHRHDLRCAAAFAIVAVGQAQADPATRPATQSPARQTLPPLGIRGRRYLGLVGERVAAEARLTPQAVHALLAQAAQTLGQRGAPGVAQACLGDLDAAVPPRPAPSRIDCAALFGVYADVLAARDPGSALAADLRGQAVALAGSGLDEGGKRQLDLAKARVRAELNGGEIDRGSATIDADDFAACRVLARHG